VFSQKNRLKINLKIKKKQQKRKKEIKKEHRWAGPTPILGCLAPGPR
jgi:hypothetical protein